MFESLKAYCRSVVPFTGQELALIDAHFESRALAKKEHLLQGGKICSFLAFIDNGSIRHFHIKDGLEKTCDISFEKTWVKSLRCKGLKFKV